MKKALLMGLLVLGALVASVALLRRGRSEHPAEYEVVASSRSLETLTRDELYALARGRDIPGRSRMKKDELLDALRRAQ